MARSFERKFTLVTAIRGSLAEGIDKIRKSARTAAAPLREFATGLTATDRELGETAEAAANAQRALDNVKGTPRDFRRSVDDLRAGTDAAERLEEALRRAAAAPGIAAQDAKALRDAARDAGKASSAGREAGTDEAVAERAAARRRLTQARVDARRLGREAAAAKARAAEEVDRKAAAKQAAADAQRIQNDATREAKGAATAAEAARDARVRAVKVANDQIASLRKKLSGDEERAVKAVATAERAEATETTRRASVQKAQARIKETAAAVQAAREREKATADAIGRATEKGLARAKKTAAAAAAARVRKERAAETAIETLREASAKAAESAIKASQKRIEADRLRAIEKTRRAELDAAEATGRAVRIETLKTLRRSVADAEAAAERAADAEVRAQREAAAEVTALRRAELRKRVADERATRAQAADREVKTIRKAPVPANAALNAAERAFRSIEVSVQGINASISQVASRGAVVSGAARAYRRLTVAVTASLGAVRRLGRGFVNLGRDLNSARRAIFNVGRALTSLRTLAVVAALAIATRGVVRYADSWLELSNRLKLINDDSRSTAAATQRVFEVAQEARAEVAATADTYFRYGRAVDALRNDQDRLANVTLLTSKAVAISATSAESASAALFQFGQGLSADALRGQELNSVLEQTPRLAKALADGIGIAQGELKQFATEGKLTAQVVVDALESQAGKLNAEFALTTSTIGQALVRLQNTIGRAVDIFFNRSGGTNGLVGLINQLTQAITDFSDVFARRVFSLGEIVSGAFDPSLTEAERDENRAALLNIGVSLGNLISAAFRSAGNALVGTIAIGVKSIVQVALAAVGDGLRDIAATLPGAEKLGFRGSSRTQLADATIEEAEAQERYNTALERARELREREEFAQQRVDNPINPSFSTDAPTAAESRRDLADAKRRRAESRSELVAARESLATLRGSIETLETEIASEQVQRASSIDRNFTEGLGTVRLLLNESKEDLKKALEDFEQAVEDSVPEIEAPVIRYGDAATTLLTDPLGFAKLKIQEGIEAIEKEFEEGRARLLAFRDFSEGLRVRDLEASGQDREASRLRLTIRQREERAEVEEKTPAFAPRLRETQEAELARFDVDTRREEIVKRITKANEELIATEERAENLLKTGNITRDQATAIVHRQREALTQATQRGVEDLDRLKEQFPELSALIQETEEQIRKLAEQPEAETPETGMAGFLAGFREAARQLNEEANNTFQLAINLVGSITDSLTTGLVGAIEAGVRGTKSWGDAFRDWAVNALISIGKVLAQAVLLAAVAAGLNAIAPGLASVLGQSAQLGAQTGQASGRNDGGVIGRSDGGPVRPGQSIGDGRFRRRAGGAGFVHGTRGPDRDTMLTALTKGEVVWSRRAVDRAGGHHQVMQWHDTLLRGFNRGGIIGGPAQPLIKNAAGPAKAAAAAGPDAAMLDTSDSDQMAPLARGVLPLLIQDLSENPDLAGRMKAVIG